MLSRDKAYEILTQYVDSDSLLKHSLAVEAGMRGYARELGADVEYWGICGLLHDVDYQKFPEEHGSKGVEILREKGYPEDILDAIQAHTTSSSDKETKMAKVLYAVDKLASFIVAVALVRPNGFEGLKVKSVKKKLKDKGFAKAVDRTEIQESSQDLEMDFTKHLQIVIDSLIMREEELKEINVSLLH